MTDFRAPNKQLREAAYTLISANLSAIQSEDGRALHCALCVPERGSFSDYPLVLVGSCDLREMKTLDQLHYAETWRLSIIVIDGVSKSASEARLSQLEELTEVKYNIIKLLKADPDSWGLRGTLAFCASQAAMLSSDDEFDGSVVSCAFSLDCQIITPRQL